MTTLVQHQDTHQMDASDFQHRNTMQQPETAKNVFVYVNGDKYYPGRRFVVNRKRVPNFDGFLNMVTDGLKAPFGAVRNIYTPGYGHRVSGLGEINSGMSVVAAGSERFRKLQYQEITEPSKRRTQPKNSNTWIKPVSHNMRMNVPARWKESSMGPCNIYVYPNGDVNATAVKMLLIPRIMKNWDMVLQEVTEKIASRTGQAVRRLHTLNGELITGSDQLDNGRYYVAVGNEKFKRVPYGERAQHLAMIHSPRRPALLPPLTRPRARTLNSKPAGAGQSYAQKYAQKKQLEEQRYQQPVPPGTEPHRRLKPLKTSTAPPPSSESDSVFHAKPVKVKRSGASGRLTQVSATDDDVFRAKGDEMRAEEVDDDDDVKVDLPIDQMPADTVEDEDIKEAPAKQEEDSDETIPEKRRTPSPSPSPVVAAENEDREAERTPSSPSRAEPQPSARSVESTEIEQQRNGSAIQPEQHGEPNEADQNAAATKIQSRYRGYKARRDFERRKEILPEASDAGEDHEVEDQAAERVEAEVTDDTEIPQTLPLLSDAEPRDKTPTELDQPHDSPQPEGENEEGAPETEDGQQSVDGAGTSQKEEIENERADSAEVAEQPQQNADDDVPDTLPVKGTETPVQDTPLNDEDAPNPADAGDADDVQSTPEEIAEPKFDLTTGQAVEEPRTRTPDNAEDVGPEKVSLPERDDGDGTEGNVEVLDASGAELSGSVNEPESAEPAPENEDSNNRTEMNDDQINGSPPARPASQSPTGEEEKADKILEKSVNEGQPIPNGQPAGIVDGDAM